MGQDYAIKFYNGKAWRRCRDGFMSSKYFICERCGGVATMAHHKRYITPANISNPEIALNWDNLESLCQDCHNRDHMSSGATAEGISFDNNGNVVYNIDLG